MRNYPADYFFSSALWHFLQTLPFSAAVWQHLWSHFFPASTVASQQAFFSSAARTLETPIKANAQTAKDTDITLTNFIFYLSRLANVRPALIFSELHTCQKRLSIGSAVFN